MIDDSKSRSRNRRWLALTALVALIAVGGYLGWNVYRTRFANLFDSEIEDASRVAALKDAPLKVATLPAAETGWPQWRGPNRDGRAPDGPFRTDWQANPPKAIWTTPCGGGYSSFAVVAGRLYSQDRTGDIERVRCLDAETGSELWHYDEAVDYSAFKQGYAAGPRATPTVHGGRIYSVGATGLFCCLVPPEKSSEAPTLAWKHDLPAKYKSGLPTWGFACSPLIVGDTAVVQPGGKRGAVAAFDLATGTQRWATGTDETGYSSPILANIAGIEQIVAITGESILGIRAATGELLWQHDWKTSFNGNIATPIVVGNYAFASSNYGKGCVLLEITPNGEGARANVVYFRKGRVMKNHHSTCVYRDGFLYGYDDDTLKCIDFRTGEENELWDARTDDGRPILKGSLILADRYLIGQRQNGTLFLAEANPEEFRFLGQVAGILSGSDCWALPVLVEGRLYVRDAAKIVCLDLRPSAK